MSLLVYDVLGWKWYSGKKIENKTVRGSWVMNGLLWNFYKLEEYIFFSIDVHARDGKVTYEM